MAAAVQQLAECRQLWPGGVDTAARLEAAIQALGRTDPQGQGKTYYLGAVLPGVAQGELLPSDPWRAPPPTLQRLGEYLQTLQGRSSRNCRQ